MRRGRLIPLASCCAVQRWRHARWRRTSTKWPDELYDQASLAIGIASLQLLSAQERWIHRRVETIDLLRREVVRRRVAVEFTLPLELHDELSLMKGGPWCVPLAVLRKGRLRNFTITESGLPLGVLGAAQNGTVAKELLTAAAALATPRTNLPSPAFEAALGDVANCEATTASSRIDVVARLALDDADAALALNDARFEYFLLTLADNYLLIAVLNDPTGRRIVEFAYDDDVRLGFRHLKLRRRVAERLGWVPVLIDIDVPGATETPSYHAEIVVPEDLRVGAFIFDTDSGALLSTTIERSVDRAALHIADVDPATVPVALVSIVPERSGTVTLALGVASVTTTLLLVGGIARDLEGPTTGTSATVLLAGSAVFAGLVARSDEHRLVRQALAGVRATLTLVALAALTAASAIGLGASEGTRQAIWTFSGCAAALATLSLIIAFARAAPASASDDTSDCDG